MFLRIAAITLILVCTSVAWIILGGTIDYRTNNSNDRLRTGVASVWGSPQVQSPPRATFQKVELEKHEKVTDGHKTVTTEERPATILLPLEGSKINVALNLEHRQKGTALFLLNALYYFCLKFWMNKKPCKELCYFYLSLQPYLLFFRNERVF